MITQTREVHRIERQSDDNVRMYLREVADPNDPASMGMGGELVITVPAVDETPTGTTYTVSISAA